MWLVVYNQHRNPNYFQLQYISSGFLIQSLLVQNILFCDEVLECSFQNKKTPYWWGGGGGWMPWWEDCLWWGGQGFCQLLCGGDLEQLILSLHVCMKVTISRALSHKSAYDSHIRPQCHVHSVIWECFFELTRLDSNYYQQSEASKEWFSLSPHS